MPCIVLASNQNTHSPSFGIVCGRTEGRPCSVGLGADGRPAFNVGPDANTAVAREVIYIADEDAASQLAQCAAGALGLRTHDA